MEGMTLDGNHILSYALLIFRFFASTGHTGGKTIAKRQNNPLNVRTITAVRTITTRQNDRYFNHYWASDGEGLEKVRNSTVCSLIFVPFSLLKQNNSRQRRLPPQLF